MHAAKSVGTVSLKGNSETVSALVDPGQPVKMCRLKFDPQLGPQILDAWHNSHDNFAYCDANHQHQLSCDHTRHSLQNQPEAMLLVVGWVVCAVAWRINKEKQDMLNWLKNVVTRGIAAFESCLAPLALVAGVCLAAVNSAQAQVIATLPAEITTLMTDAEGLRDDAITFKVVVVGAIIGFAFILWITRRK